MALIKAKQIDPTGLAAVAFTPIGVTSGQPLTVPVGYQWTLYSDTLLVEDDLTLEGDLVMLL